MTRLREVRLTRRSILGLLGGGVAAGLIAACGGGASPTAAPAKPADSPAGAQSAGAKPAEPTKPAAAEPTKPAVAAEPTKPAAAAEAKPQPATPTPFVPPKRPTPAPGKQVVTFWYHWGSVIGQGME